MIEGCRESCDVTEADRPGQKVFRACPRSVFIEAAGLRCGGGKARGLALCAAVVQRRR